MKGWDVNKDKDISLCITEEAEELGYIKDSEKAEESDIVLSIPPKLLAQYAHKYVRIPS